MEKIWKHFPGYASAREDVRIQSTEADLELIDNLWGRGGLPNEASPAEIKREALRQMEIDWRSSEDETATFWVRVAKAMQR